MDDARSSGLTSLGSNAFEGIEHLPSVNNLTEDGVFSIEPVAWDEGHEELGSVGVGSSVGHRQISSSSVLHSEVFVWELVTVDGLSTGSVASSLLVPKPHFGASFLVLFL